MPDSLPITICPECRHEFTPEYETAEYETAPPVTKPAGGMFTVAVSIIDIAAYIAERPALLAAFTRWCKAESMHESWSTLQELKKLEREA